MQVAEMHNIHTENVRMNKKTMKSEKIVKGKCCEISISSNSIVKENHYY